jgi:hypothetical protein
VKLLETLRIVRLEYDSVAKHNRHRLRPEAVEQGLGYRVISSQGCPFDVLSPKALELVRQDLPGFLASLIEDRLSREAAQALEAADQHRTEKLDSEGKTLWLLDHYPDLTQAQVAKVVGVSERLVRKYKAKREKQLESLRKYRPPQWSGLPSTDAHRAAL